MKRRAVKAAGRSGQVLLITCSTCGQVRAPYCPDQCRECFERLSARNLRDHFRSRPPGPGSDPQ